MLANIVGLRRMFRAFRCQIQSQNFRLPKQHCQRCTQIVRKGGEQRVTNLLAFARKPGLFFTCGQQKSFQRRRRQQGESFQQPLLLRNHQLA
ncbi:hypothetical protein D3C75_697920 [compost metagenome]